MNFVWISIVVPSKFRNGKIKNNLVLSSLVHLDDIETMRSANARNFGIKSSDIPALPKKLMDFRNTCLGM